MRTIHLFSNRIGYPYLLIIALIILFSCRRSTTGIDPNSFDNTEMVVATVYGCIKDENDNAIPDADITCSGHTTHTNQSGFFIFRNISTPRKATTVLVKKNSFFNGSRTIVVKKGHVHRADMILMQLGTPQTFSSVQGASVQFNELTLQFNANSMVDQQSGNPYNGLVNVYARVLDPVSTLTAFTMPGDLRGLTQDGNVEKKLTSYGMFAVELRDASGNLLQIKHGSTAHVKLNLSASLLMSAQSTIPMWYYDESKGMWMEEGQAVLQNGSYEGDVGHFSFWNLDMISNPIYFDATFVDQNNQPLAGYLVALYNPNLNSTSFAVTDNNGWVGGLAYANANLVLKLAAYNGYCGHPLYFVQNITTSNVNYSMGTVSVNVSSFLTCSISGTVVDCNSNPVPNTYVLILSMGVYIPTNSNGAFTYYMSCVPLYPVKVAVIDSANVQVGYSSMLLSPGANNIGYILACGSTFSQVHIESYFTGDGGFPHPFGGASLQIDYQNANVVFFGSGNFDLLLYTQDTTSGPHPVTGCVQYVPDCCHAYPDGYCHLDSTMNNTITYTNFPHTPGPVDGTFDIWVKGGVTGTQYHTTGTFKALRN